MTHSPPTMLDLAPDWARLRVAGADARAFLQGQLGNDLGLLEAGRAQLSSYSSPKGRLLAVLTLQQDDDAIEIELPRGLLDPIARRLRMFVLRSKLTIVESPASILGLLGHGSADALAAAGLPVPERPLDVASADGVRVLRRFGDAPRYSLHGAPEALAALTPKLGVVSEARDPWTRADVLAGVPVVLPSTQDHFVAQMANLDLLGGISFDKGCYTGQEIVARLHYLGQLKRRMYRVRGAGPAPAPGTPVHESGQEQAVGEIVQAVADEGGFIAGAVLQIAQATSETLRVGESALSTPQPYGYMLAKDLARA